MKVVIQIPCWNEAAQLPDTLASLPRSLPGIDHLDWLVIDDGSTDDTVAVARSLGVDHVVQLPFNQGLARAFAAGLEAACRNGADIVVNVDADNQYDARAIPLLIQQIVEKGSDLVVGCRPISNIQHFSVSKKLLQRMGSAVVRNISGLKVADATSGFRAYSREAAMRLNVYSRYTYTLETLIQAGQTGLRVSSVPVAINPPTRPSRLIKNVRSYVTRSMFTILRAFLTYRPMRFFLIPAFVSGIVGTLIGATFVKNYLDGNGDGHIQSLILATILIVIGTVCTAVALLANQLAINRRLLEDIQFNWRRMYWRPQP
jgi:glycosyltransferase involved in cell wall biosynthesis